MSEVIARSELLTAQEIAILAHYDLPTDIHKHEYADKLEIIFCALWLFFEEKNRISFYEIVDCDNYNQLFTIKKVKAGVDKYNHVDMENKIFKRSEILSYIDLIKVCIYYLHSQTIACSHTYDNPDYEYGFCSLVISMKKAGKTATEIARYLKDNGFDRVPIAVLLSEDCNFVTSGAFMKRADKLLGGDK